MEQILFINACVRENSRTLRLAGRALRHLNGKIQEICLGREPILPLTQTELIKRDALLSARDYADESLRHAREFAEADRIVIAAPYWDLTFPALLKIYLERVTVSGVTFFYRDGVPQSLCRAKQLIYVTTAGGPIFANLGFEYIRALATGFFGIQDIRFFKAENLDIIGADIEGILCEAEKQIDASLRSRA